MLDLDCIALKLYLFFSFVSVSYVFTRIHQPLVNYPTPEQDSDLFITSNIHM